MAPDYVLVDSRIKETFYKASKEWLVAFFSENPCDSPDYGRIINNHHFLRLKDYLKQGKVVIGGNYKEEQRFIEPTLLEVTDLGQPVMQDEVFGPILPVIEYSSPEEAERIIALNPNPLAFYIFSQDKAFIQRFIKARSLWRRMYQRYDQPCIKPALTFWRQGHQRLWELS